MYVGICMVSLTYFPYSEGTALDGLLQSSDEVFTPENNNTEVPRKRHVNYTRTQSMALGVDRIDEYSEIEI